MFHHKKFPTLILIPFLMIVVTAILHFGKGHLPEALRARLDPIELPASLQAFRDSQENEQVLQRAWLLAQQANAYEFHTEIEQTTYHAPALTNVGRPASVDSMYLEGKTDTKAKNFQVAIWQGGSILERDRAYEVRTDGEATYGRAQNGQWEKIDDVTTLFAPNRDLLSYLHSIKNVREVRSAVDTYRQFQFDLDSPAFAETMRRQLEEQLRSGGKLPPGITLDTPSAYQGIVGGGEIWLTGEGLPAQLNFTLDFPQQRDGHRVHAVIRTDFTDFESGQLVYAAAPFGGAPLWLANQIGRLSLVNWSQVGMQGSSFLLFALATWLVVRIGRKRPIYIALNTTIIASIVLTPLLQSTQVAAFQQEQAAATQAETDPPLVEKMATWNPQQSPLAVADARTDVAAQETLFESQPQAHASVSTYVAAQQTTASTVDSDQDGVPDAEEPNACVGKLDCDDDTLTDLQESRLGTALDKEDSDNDKLRDDLEVKGFNLGSRLWYSNPNDADTNDDGLPDTVECWREETALDLISSPTTLACDRDSDLDGIPDLFAYDNDGDGVDDLVDLSPFHQSEAIYSQQTPFSFQSNGLTQNEPLFVDFQLVPTSPNQISYARNVLDWPTNDTKGQVVRTEESTFATGKPSGSYLPNEEIGDLRFMPMVEITIPAEDASSILPVTDFLTVTRTGTGYTKVISVTQDSRTQATEQPWLHTTVELIAFQGNSTVALSTLTDNDRAPITVDKVQIFHSTCPVGASEKPLLEKTTPTAQGDLWALDDTALPSILDGQHVLLFLKTSSNGELQSLCMPLGDAPNGTLPFWEMFDTPKLDAYGVSLRDSVDLQDNTAKVIAYLPANVITGQTGGEKQAFGARMPYWPTATDLGGAQQVRLVWLVQLLGDDGSTQIIQTYSNESWKLAGLSARQDLEMHSAVIYQNPDSEFNTGGDFKSIHARLWPTADVLDEHFAKGTANRLSLNDRLLPRLEFEFSAPAGSLGATITTYQTQDELARVPAEVTPGILAKFLNNGAYKDGYDHVLLLFAREEVYKVAYWNGSDTLTLPSTSDSLTAYSWKPFRHTAEGWGSFPAREYLDLLHVRLNEISHHTLSQENLSPDDFEATLGGMVLANQAFAMGMLYGANRMVALDSTPLESEADEENSLPDDIGEGVVGAILDTVSGELAEELAKEAGVLANVSARNSVTALGKALKTKSGEYTAAFGKGGELDARLGAAGLSISVVSLALTVGNLISGNETAATAIETTLSTLSVVSASMDTALAVKEAVEATSAGGNSIAAAMKTAKPITRAAKIAAVAGLVLTVGVSAGIFIAQWSTGAFSLTSLGFTAALSGVIAAAVVATLMLAIGFIPIVGQVIVAVVALIDGLIAGICAVTKAAGFDLEEATTLDVPRTGGAKLSFCAGITGLATEGVRFLMFSQTVLVGNMQGSDRLKTSNFQLNLENSNLGFQVGNSFRPTLRVDNKIELVDQPFDWKSALYFWQFNWDLLDNTTHRYDLTTEADDRDVSTSEMEGEWQELSNGVLTGSHRSPGIQYDDPLIMVPVTATLPDAQATIPFTTAGINVPVALYLREAYANPAQECLSLGLSVPICYVRGGDTGTNNIDLRLAYDIFPASLDEFYAGQVVGEGVSLAWGQSGDLTFPVMHDFDGDGLRTPASGGNDPDDRYWDTDGDALNDLFETQQGTGAHLSDTDADGLDDRIELLVGSNPLQRDSDGDGLLDGEELFHQDILDQDEDGDGTEWIGGWEFVYDVVNGVAQKTWVTSNPLAWDTDEDGLSDAQEQVYGLNPRVHSDTTVLKLNSQIAETHAPITLLRFEERTGATTFADASGHLNNASCRGTSCPAAGHEGRYTNGVVFDGVDDSLRLPEAVPLANHSFTVAFWAQRSRTDGSDYVLISGRPEIHHGLSIGFDTNQQFICSFFENVLRENNAAPDTAWHHWACTYDVTTQTRTLYRDGAVVGQDITFAYQGSGDWEIGGYTEAENPPWYNGALDELVVVPTALDAGKIALLMEARYNPGGLQLLAGPGDSLTYAATLENNLLGKSLVGQVAVEAPANWRGVNPLTTYKLEPGQNQTLRGDLAIDELATSGTYSVTLTAGAAASHEQAPTSRPSESSIHLPFENTLPNETTKTHSGTPSTEREGVNGQALRFDGRTILDANDPAFDLSNTPFAISIWVKPDKDVFGTRAIFGQPPDARDWQYTNSGVHLRIQEGRSLTFGWGESWNTNRIENVVTPGVWNHIVVNFDQTDLTIYVNGSQVSRNSVPNSRPVTRQLFTLGDDNYCGEFELKNVYTIEDGDGPGSAEYYYTFQDDRGEESRLIYDEDADSGDWEPGDGPSNGEWFTDKKYTFCDEGAHVYVYEHDNFVSGEALGPDVYFDFATGEQTGYSRENFETFRSPELSGDGEVKFYYEVRNPVRPYVGSLDELRLYRRALTEREVQQLYGGAEIAYHYTFDDPPGAGLNNAHFNFTNEGAISDPSANGYCNQNECPHSGVAGRVNRAVALNGTQSIRIDNLAMPATAPGFAIWAKPLDSGMIFRLAQGTDRLLFRLTWHDNAFCIDSSCSPEQYPAGEWAHLMVNYGANGATLYINGVNMVTSASHQWAGAGRYDLVLGDGLTGLLDDLQIPYDGSAVAATMNAAPRLTLHLDESGTGLTEFENVGSVNATCSGNACPSGGRTGKMGHAAAFDGVDDGLNTPDSNALDLDHFTLAAWVKPAASRSGASYQPIVAKTAAEDSSNYAIYLTSERKIYAVRACNSATLITTSESTLPLDQYTHVAASYDGRQLAIYINGVLDQSELFAAGATCINDAPVTIGAPYNVSQSSYGHFSGNLDEVQLYDHALWDYQIKSLYDGEANWFEEHDGHTVAVDAEPPTSSLTETLLLAINHYANADVQLGVTTADASSDVTLLELGVSVNGGPATWMAAQPCEDAAQSRTDSPAWCPWFKPSQWGGEGRYTIQTRATDAVGHRETPTVAYTILVDGSGPQLTATESSIVKLVRHPNVAAAQVLPLAGTVSDPAIAGDAGSGVRHVWVTLRNAQGDVVGDPPYAATINGENWSMQYPIYQAEVAGNYTLEVSAEDGIGNQSTLPPRTLTLDGAPRSITLNEFASGLPTSQATLNLITTTTIFQGWVSESPLPPGARFVYPFEEHAGATSFTNALATSGWLTPSVATCSGNACPTSAVAANEGFGIKFDGADDYVTLPDAVAQSDDFTFAAWVFWQGGKAWERIFDLGQDSSHYLFLTPTTNDGKLRFAITQNGIAGEQRLQTDSALPMNQWVHVAVVLGGDSGHIYVNGVEQARGTITLNPRQVAGRNVWLGRSHFVEDPYFNGMMDQVVIYHHALSGDEVNALAAPKLVEAQSASSQSSSVSFTPLWAAERSGVHSPHLAPQREGQLLYLPLDETVHPENATTNFRNLAFENAESASCSQGHCPEPGGRSPAGGTVDFDGVDDYISLPGNVPGNVKDTDDFSFAAWVHWRGGQPWQRIFDFGQDENNYLYLTPSTNENVLMFAMRQNGSDVSWIRTTGALPIDQWVHVAVTLVGDTSRVYLNGVEQASGSMLIDPRQIVGSNLWLGRSQFPNDPYFNGMLGEVRAFARGLSAEEVRSLWLGDRALLSLTLDTPLAQEGDMLTDESGWNQHAILHSGTGDTVNKAVAGHQGPYALDFDSVDDYVSLPGMVTESDDFTFAAWVYWRGGEAGQRLFDFGQDGSNSLYFTPSTIDAQMMFAVSKDAVGGSSIATTPVLPIAQWVHVAMIMEGDMGRIYLNGVEQVSGAMTINPRQVAGENLWLGRSQVSTDPYFNGMMDDVRVYARALKAAEITDLAKTGWQQVNLDEGRSNWSFITPTGLEGEYRVDLLSTDNGGNIAYNPLRPAVNYTIDSTNPRATYTRQTNSVDNGNQYTYRFHAYDNYLSEQGLVTPCGDTRQIQKGFRVESNVQNLVQLNEVTVTCTLDEIPASETITICDMGGNCTSLAPSEAQAQVPSLESASALSQPPAFPNAFSPQFFAQPESSVGDRDVDRVLPGG